MKRGWRFGTAVWMASAVLSGAVSGQTYLTDVTPQAAAGIPYLFGARGQTFGDSNNDGWPDLFLAMDRSSRLSLWLNQGNGRFFDEGPFQFAGLSVSFLGGGSVFGDYDNDGDLDLFVPVGAYFYMGQSLLLRNEGGQFHDVAQQAGLVRLAATDNAIWLDYDRDGYLDLYASGQGSRQARNRLYRGRDDGTFEEVTAAAGLDLSLSPDGGGSNGGMVAADLNDDGWPDLYLGVYEEPNRLFLSDGRGRFTDATTEEIGDRGQAFGVAVGDIDNDGDLDLYQAAGGGLATNRSLMLVNLGHGQFLDATDGIGLGGVIGDVGGPALADIDNDGDLDLLLAFPFQLFLNNGDGTFIDQTAQAQVAPTGDYALATSIGDYDLDGFPDVALNVNRAVIDRPGLLYLCHASGNGNHYLRVELVGIRSNRSAIGARLFATVGQTRQLREILGGKGYSQDELVAHFGLGAHTRVDRLEVRWPSGQVDVLTDIPADQQVRIFEGRPGYYVAKPTVANWAGLPDTLVAGTGVPVRLTVHPALFEPDAVVTGVTADLGGLGGPAGAGLREEADGTWTLAARLEAATVSGVQVASVKVSQSTSLGAYWTRITRGVVVTAAEDLRVFDDALHPDWTAAARGTAQLDLTEAAVVASGGRAAALHSAGNLSISFTPPAPVEPVGYRLHFMLHPGDAVWTAIVPQFFVSLGTASAKLKLLGSEWLDQTAREWRAVDIPVEAFRLTGPIDRIEFTGNQTGTVYVDDLRLVTVHLSGPPGTAVWEDETTGRPQAVSLRQNYPNPFNSSTVLEYALPMTGEVDLSVYNLAGQRVVTLVSGRRAAGRYTAAWDGSNDQGAALASGVYVYRLRCGGQGQRRKLLLLR